MCYGVPTVCWALPNSVSLPGVCKPTEGFLLPFPSFVLCFCACLFTLRESVGVRIALEGQARICFSPIPQMRELRFREVKSPAQRHSTTEWQSPEWPQCPSTSKLSPHLSEVLHRQFGKPHFYDFLIELARASETIPSLWMGKARCRAGQESWLRPLLPYLALRCSLNLSSAFCILNTPVPKEHLVSPR